MVEPTTIVEQLRWKLGENALKLQHTADGVPTCWIARQNAHDALRFLKDEVDRPFRMLYDLTAIDERLRMHREQQGSDFTIVYHLMSFGRNEYIRVKVPLKSGQPPIDTATDLWPAANWYEGEVWEMFGIRFHGHPHLERILKPNAWVGHPLLNDYPARATEMGPFLPIDEKEEAEEEGLRFRPEDWGTGPDRAGMDFMFLNVGAPYPDTHGVLRLALQLDGEKIVDAVPEIGFNHCEEKMAERQLRHTYIRYTGRMDCPDGVVSKMAYLMAVEKLGQIEVPQRAKVIRVMLAESFRIISHLVWYQTFGRDLGQPLPVLSTFPEREAAFAIVEAVCGARMRPNLFCIGSLEKDLPKDWDALVRDVLKYLPSRLIEYDKELLRNKTYKTRTQGVGAFTTEEAIEWGVTGPNLRATGLEWDFRKKHPYSGYEQFEFDIPTGRHGDCYDRGVVRVEEMRQSLRIIEQCVNNMPEGHYKSAQSQVWSPLKEQPVIPAGEAFCAVEATEGNNGYYLVSDGEITPYRIRRRTPSFAHMQMLPQLVRGRMISDVLPVLGAVDYVLADVNR
jgi:NADH-quinone oxidoreductase subunit C/D